MSRQPAKCTREDPCHGGSHDSVLNRVSSEAYACACSVTTFARDFSVLLSCSVSVESRAKRKYSVDLKHRLQEVVFLNFSPGLTFAQISYLGHHSAFIRPPCWRPRGPWGLSCRFLHFSFCYGQRSSSENLRIHKRNTGDTGK